MKDKWHQAAFARAAYALADRRFIHSLKKFSFAPVLAGTVSVWLQVILAWSLALCLHPAFAIVSFFVLASAQQTMATWVHEGSHHNLFKDKKLNDLWVNFFFAAPIGMNVATYRAGHLSHHAYLSSHDDSDRHVHAVDLTGSKVWYEIGKRLVGWEGFKVAFQKYLPIAVRDQNISQKVVSKPRPTLRFLAVAILWNCLFLAACIFAGRWYLYFLLWVYPLFAVAQLFNMVRTCAEHQPEMFPAVELDEPPIVRTTLPYFLEKWLIYGINFNYHLEHHLWPQIPFFQLPELHAHLRERGFYDRYPDLLQRSAFASFLRLHRKSERRQHTVGVVQ